jgi:hypothetical protein
MGFGGQFMILFWILVMLEILRERYARDEIIREEYEQKRRDLEPPARGKPPGFRGQASRLGNHHVRTLRHERQRCDAPRQAAAKTERRPGRDRRT